MLITHDLRESVFLADQVVVMSGRPAHAQYVLDVDIPGKRNARRSLCAQIGRDAGHAAPPDPGRAGPHRGGVTTLRPPPPPPETGPQQTDPGGDAMNDTARKILAPTLFIVAILAFWEWVVWYNELPDFRMASPSDLIPRYIQFWDLFLIKSWGNAVAGQWWGWRWPWWSAPCSA